MKTADPELRHQVLRHQVLHVKSMASLVSQSTGITPSPDHLVRDGLLLDRESKLQVKKTLVAREDEMRDIIDKRRQKWNQERLVADRKDGALSRLGFELQSLQTGADATTSSASALQGEVMAARRMEVRLNARRPRACCRP